RERAPPRRRTARRQGHAPGGGAPSRRHDRDARLGQRARLRIGTQRRAARAGPRQHALAAGADVRRRAPPGDPGPGWRAGAVDRSVPAATRKRGAMTPFSALLVDDEPLALVRLRTLLKSERDVRIVGECEDGRAAVEAIRRLRPDVVFLDVQMPEKDGFEVLGELLPAERPLTI